MFDSEHHIIDRAVDNLTSSHPSSVEMPILVAEVLTTRSASDLALRYEHSVRRHLRRIVRQLLSNHGAVS